MGIIHNLKRQERNQHKHPSYLGPTEDVSILVSAAFVKYERNLRGAVIDYDRVTLPRKEQDIEVSFLDINLGAIALQRPGNTARGLLSKDIRYYSPLDERLHEMIFQSIDHSEALWGTSRAQAYQIGILDHTIHNAQYKQKESFALEWIEKGKKKRAEFYVGNLTFSVEAKIQYRFTPCLGGFDELEKFNLRGEIMIE